MYNERILLTEACGGERAEHVKRKHYLYVAKTEVSKL